MRLVSNIGCQVIGLAGDIFNHANVHLPWGPLKYLIVTPDFHHWHHSSDTVAIDRNYAAHYAFLDWIFGTAIRGQKGFPQRYGVVGDYMPDGFVRQQLFPLRGPGVTGGPRPTKEPGA